MIPSQAQLRPTLPLPDLNMSWLGEMGAGGEDVDKKGDRALTLRGSQERLLSLENCLKTEPTGPMKTAD